MRLPLLRALCIAALIGLLPASFRAAEARDVQIGPPPEWVNALAFSAAANAPESSVGQHYLLIETQSHIEKRAIYRHNAYRILDEGGLRYGSQINLSFDPAYETLTIHYVRLIRGTEVLDRLDRAKIQVLQRENDLDYLLYNGSLSALLILDDVRVGDIVELAFTKVGRNPVFGEHYIEGLTLDWGMPIAHLRHRVVLPAERTIAHRILGNTTIKPREIDSPAGREWVWEGRDLPAVVYDRNIPAWQETGASVQLTDFSSWSDVVRWALPLYAETTSPDVSVSEKAAALSAAASTPEERALLALRFVQDEIRYLGIEAGPGSHRPSPPETVLGRRFGDCKDKARLLVALLRRMGFNAKPVLVHSSRRHTLADWLPSPFAFDHVVVLFQFEGADYVLDPTFTQQRGGLRQRHTGRYHSGLVIDAGTTGLAQWPTSPNDVTHTRVEEEFTIPAFDAPATLHVRSTYTARSAERMRSYLSGTKRDDIAKSYLDFYARYFPEIVTAQPISWQDDDAANTIVLEEHYTVRNIFVRQADEKILKAGFYPSALSDYISTPGAGGRKWPLAVAHPVDISNRIRVTLPELWSIESKSTQVSDSAFTYDLTASGKGKIVEWVYHWRSRADHVTPANFADHSRNVARVNDTLGSALTYQPDGERGFQFNWAMIALAGFTVTGASFGAHRLWRRREIEDPPPLPDSLAQNTALTGLGGWLVLVGIGVVLRPLLTINALRTATAYFNKTTWAVLTSADSSLHQPTYQWIAPAEMVLTLISLVGSVLAVGTFFSRRKSFPTVMIGLLVLDLVMLALDIVATHTLTTSTPGEVHQAYGAFLRGIIPAAIWIPYFCVSRRVKLTFTR